MVLATYLFLLLYIPRIGFFGDFTVIIAVFLMGVAALKGAVEPLQVRRARGTILLLFIAILLYSSVLFAINHPRELIFLLRYGRSMFQFLGCYALIRLYYCKYKEDAPGKAMEHLYWAIAAHAVIMFGMYVSETFRELIFKLVQADVYEFERRGFREGTRINGLVGALDSLSVVQSFGILLFPLIAKRLKGTRAIAGSIAFLLILGSIIISARTGIILLIIFMPILLIVTKQDIGKILIRLALSCIVLAAGAFAVTPGEEIRERFSHQIERLGRVFEALSIATEEGQGVGALGKLMSDYREDWPKDPGIFLFGNSMSCRTPQYHIAADPGWILDVHGIGIFGSALVLIFYIICLWHGFKCMPYNKYVGIICVLYTFQAFIVNSKGRFFMTRVGLTLSCVLVLLSIYCRSFGSQDEQVYTEDMLEYPDYSEDIQALPSIY